MKRLLYLLIAGFVTLVLIAVLQTPALPAGIANPSFESGEAGWDGFYGGMNWTVIEPQYPPFYLSWFTPAPAPDGGRIAVCKGSNYPLELVSQTVLSPGTYRIALSAGRLSPDVYGTDVSLVSGTRSIPLAPGWTEYAWEESFISPTRLSFAMLGSGDPWAGIDNIRVSPVPEPAGCAALIVGLSALALQRRKKREESR